MNRIILVLLALFTLLFSVTSCDRYTDQEGTPKHREPFFVQWKSDNGSSLSLEGPSRVLPGEEIPFVLRMNNMAQSNWNGKYCLFLLRQPAEVKQLLNGAYSLKPETGEEFVLNVQIPNNLAEDAYGLALVMPGSMASITTIHVGKSNDASAGSWPEPQCIDR